MGIGPTGLHEWAWMRFGLTFQDLLDEVRSRAVLGDARPALRRGEGRSERLCRRTRPARIRSRSRPSNPPAPRASCSASPKARTCRPRRQYLRWVQFKGSKRTGNWADDSDPLLAAYEATGYPVQSLQSFPGMSIVGFPTMPRIMRLAIGDGLVTAPEATPESSTPGCDCSKGIGLVTTRATRCPTH